ncbi:3666_t:CDS:2 [Ambispora gerdemannii]|uniref:3666_t:CDS:1 n=1 Tax=Ambispora gerdemannii TaxID=144530 RepID=A0A9N8ZDJ0_9GLOM|nr:3666_t:CDS:2 [Ambispora gerdemannii]
MVCCCNNSCCEIPAKLAVLHKSLFLGKCKIFIHTTYLSALPSNANKTIISKIIFPKVNYNKKYLSENLLERDSVSDTSESESITIISAPENEKPFFRALLRWSLKDLRGAGIESCSNHRRQGCAGFSNLWLWVFDCPITEKMEDTGDSSQSKELDALKK